MSALDAVRDRRSWSKVTEEAPDRAQLLPLIEAAGRVADHSSLRPWRLIELRDDDRLVLGSALAESVGDDKPSTKPLRASLLIAVVVCYRPSEKVPRWEQEAVASGVAHMLSLLLDEAGWGVIWRTGSLCRTAAVARAHGLGPDEELLGWLYVGGIPEGKDSGRRKNVPADELLTRMPQVSATTDADGAADESVTRGGESRTDESRADESPTDESHADESRVERAERSIRKATKKARKAAKKARKAAHRARDAAHRAEDAANRAERASASDDARR